MALTAANTPLPGDRITQRNPLLITAPDWFDLPADATQPAIIDHDNFGGQVLDLRAVGGRPESNVNVRVQGEISLENEGPTTKRQDHDAEAIPDLNDPLRRGIVATEAFSWSVFNRSNTNFTATQAGQDPYQSFLVYEIRELTVLEKLQLDIPLVPGSETQLAEEVLPGQDFSLRDRDHFNLPPTELDPIYRPNLEGKNVLEEDVETRVVDVNSDEKQTIAQERVRRSAGAPQDVIYLTGITGNWLEFGSGDGLTVHIASRSDEFYTMHTFGLPAMGGAGGIQGGTNGNTFPAFHAPLHIPFFDEMRVWLESENDLVNVDVQVEWARVQRTLPEKALYDLDDEITSPGEVSRQRRSEIVAAKENLFDQIQTKLRAGLPIRLERRQTEEMAPA